MFWTGYVRAFVRLILIGLLFSKALCSNAQRGILTFEVGGALTQGAPLDSAAYLPYGRHFVDEHPAVGHGLQIGVGYVVGSEDLIVRFRTGLRVEFRSYRQDIRTESRTSSPSSFRSSIYSYADKFTLKETSLGIPFLLQFRIGSRSTVLFGPEFQIAFPQRIWTHGVLTTTTTHYALPSYTPDGTSVATSSYYQDIEIRRYSRTQAALLLGYRFRIGDRFLLGPDACLFLGNDHPHDRISMRWEYAFWFAWAFADPNKETK